MKSYELIIETHQPTCGGKPPKVYQFMEVETDDPVAYVRQREGDANLDVHTNLNGDLIVEINDGKRQLQYQFSEV